MKELAKRVKQRDVMLFNLSVMDDDLRQTERQSNVMHIAPSRAMLMDALAQYLVSHKWRKVLVLKGPTQDDAKLFTAFERSTKKFELKLVDVRAFILGRDPRQRNRNNIALLTAGKDYDVVFVADSDGEFAREVPYQTQKPRSVIGGAGLVADWWRWAWDRHSAPQLNKRFLKKAKRLMTGYDWSAWTAVKGVVEAVQRTGSTEFSRLKAYLNSDEIVIDGFKGDRMSYRAWNNQLRQPIFLTTSNWVVERAPLDGFLHECNNLDTLGYDQRESLCKF